MPYVTWFFLFFCYRRTTSSPLRSRSFFSRHPLNSIFLSFSPNLINPSPLLHPSPSLSPHQSPFPFSITIPLHLPASRHTLPPTRQPGLIVCMCVYARVCMCLCVCALPAGGSSREGCSLGKWRTACSLLLLENQCIMSFSPSDFYFSVYNKHL